MKKFRTLTVLAVAAVVALAGATSAQAAGQSYTINCSSPTLPTGRLATTTTGYTTHNWTNLQGGGQTKQSYWTTGGSRASTGYQYSAVTVAATTFSGGSTGCV